MTQLNAEAIEVIERLGGNAKTATLCEVSPAAVSQWRHNGIPKAQIKFLKAVRPEVFENLPPAQPPPPDRPRRNLPDGKNIMSLGADDPDPAP